MANTFSLEWELDIVNGLFTFGYEHDLARKYFCFKSAVARRKNATDSRCYVYKYGKGYSAI